LVDRPANPEAVFDCWKAAAPPAVAPGHTEPCVIEDKKAVSEHIPSAQQPFNAPIQIWACTVPGHRHLAKADALKCLKDHTGLGEEGRASTVAPAKTANDKKKRWGTEFPNSGADKIETEGPRSDTESEKTFGLSMKKTLCDPAQIARVVADLLWLRDAFELDTGRQNDQTRPPVRLPEMIDELCDFLSSLTTAEMGETQANAEPSSSPLAAAMPGMLGAITDGCDTERAAALFRNRDSHVQHLSGRTIKAKHSQADQALLDMAHFACHQCLEIDGLSLDEQASMEDARHYLQQAGATPIRLRTAEDGEDEDSSSPSLECSVADGPDVDVVKLHGVLNKGLRKRQRAHQNLMDLAHECLRVLTGGGVCKQTAKVGARHSRSKLQNSSKLRMAIWSRPEPVARPKAPTPFTYPRKSSAGPKAMWSAKRTRSPIDVVMKQC
jgi:hypothetical protein